jgi:hypothetical protein
VLEARCRAPSKIAIPLNFEVFVGKCAGLENESVKRFG